MKPRAGRADYRFIDSRLILLRFVQEGLNVHVRFRTSELDEIVHPCAQVGLLRNEVRTGRLMVSDFVLRTRGGLSVTEITLSDGRLVRATLHVKSVKLDPKKPGAIDVSYNVIAEIMATPETPISDVHETIQ